VDANDKLVSTIINLYNDVQLKEVLSRNIKKMEVKESSLVIANHALDLLKK